MLRCHAYPDRLSLFICYYTWLDSTVARVKQHHKQDLFFIKRDSHFLINNIQ